MENKICRVCYGEKPLSDFHKRQDSKDGYRNECIICNNKKKLIYYIDNKEIINKTRNENRLNNIDKIKEQSKIYRDKNKDKVVLTIKKWKEANIDYVKSYQKEYKERTKLIRNEKEKEKKLNDPLYKLKHNIRNIVYKSLKRKGFSKTTKTHEILGCSYDEFKTHIESKFEDWMNWDNYGNPADGIIEPNKTWDIDHIEPLERCISEKEIIDFNHYSNLQPLCSYYNRNIKRDN